MGLPPYCRNCGTQEDVSSSVSQFKRLLMCTACHTVAYCSKDCQRAHWKQHKPHCRAVQDLVDSMTMAASDGTTVTSATRRERGTSAVGANNDQEGPNAEAEK